MRTAKKKFGCILLGLLFLWDKDTLCLFTHAPAASALPTSDNAFSCSFPFLLSPFLCLYFAPGFWSVRASKASGLLSRFLSVSF